MSGKGTNRWGSLARLFDGCGGERTPRWLTRLCGPEILERNANIEFSVRGRLRVACGKRGSGEAPQTGNVVTPVAPPEVKHSSRALARLRNPHEVAVAGATLFVTDQDLDDPNETADIIAIPLGDGGAPSRFATKQRSGQSLTVVDSELFWVVSGDSDRNESDWIVKMPIAGGKLTRVAKTTVLADDVIGAHGGSIFFLGPIALQGGDASVLKLGVHPNSKPTKLCAANRNSFRQAFAVDALNVYWLEPSGIVKAAVGGESSVATLVAAAQQVRGMVSDGTFLYWTEMNGGRNGEGVVQRQPVLGGAVEVLASSQNRPWGIAVDEKSVYWATNDEHDGQIMKRDKTAGTVRVIASGQRAPVHVAVDATNVYWANAADGMVMAANK